VTTASRLSGGCSGGKETTIQRRFERALIVHPF
jgi:hypothetical protein